MYYIAAINGSILKSSKHIIDLIFKSKMIEMIESGKGTSTEIAKRT